MNRDGLRQAQEKTDRVCRFANMGLADLRRKRNQAVAERDAAIERGVCAIYYLEVYFELVGLVRQQLIDEHDRAERAEALVDRRGKALLAIKRSVSKGEMRRIAIQAAPAEAQAQQKEERCLAVVVSAPSVTNRHSSLTLAVAGPTVCMSRTVATPRTWLLTRTPR